MIREGSVGLLILLGLGTFAGLILWIRGINPGNRNYRFLVSFTDVAGVQAGTPVRYRGAPVGKVTKTQPGTNGVEIEIEISSSDLIIPRDVVIEPSQAGVLAGTAVDITPIKPLTGAVAAKPLDRDCNSDVIICNNDRLTGRSGVGVDELFRASIRVANAYSDPKLIANVNAVVRNSAEAAAEVTRLSRQVSGVAEQFGSVAQAAQQQLGTVSDSTRAFSQTAQSINLTATKLGLTADQVNALLVTNRSTLVGTLGNINQITADLRSTVATLAPVVDRVQQGELLQNLESLSANAAQASAEFRDLSQTLNTPANLMTIQQTLDSARATFQNVQKITTDLDELTGDPKVRESLRNLIQGLGRLVSSTQDLQQQTQLAELLSLPVAPAVGAAPAVAPSPPPAPEPISATRSRPAEALPEKL
jgi:phospholipid/cholesterol/gamma-HCH transport system substrate-binding protein